jgi:glycerol transport system permease protein
MVATSETYTPAARKLALPKVRARHVVMVAYLLFMLVPIYWLAKMSF